MHLLAAGFHLGHLALGGARFALCPPDGHALAALLGFDALFALLF
jgi:hypothetical protein